MTRICFLWWVATWILGIAGCGVYSPYGAQTSGASTFSVEDFEPAHPLVSATSAQSLSEALRDRVQRQSTLRLVPQGDLQFSARVVGWDVRPVNVQGDETAGANRITVEVVLTYVNSLDPELSAERTFSRYVDLPSTQDVFSAEEDIVSELGELLSQDIFNATLGNW
ncbi:MAG: LPS assembly lipoprotein LptE [Bacteroidetes bacterium]|nr:LPS assembly lipoprotein LptE [Bacteroidota bacterium]MDA1242284.1 LPS assembly lipoprotein LptE [Bacteroidota bacterium]